MLISNLTAGMNDRKQTLTSYVVCDPKSLFIIADTMNVPCNN